MATTTDHTLRQTQARNPGTNGGAPKHDLQKAVPTKTEAVDLSIDPGDLKLAKEGESGEPTLLGYFSALSAAYAAVEAIGNKLVEVNRAAAKRLHDAGHQSIRIHEGKSAALDSPLGRLYRVRGVNGMTNTYQLYSSEPKPRKKGAVVDLDTL